MRAHRSGPSSTPRRVVALVAVALVGLSAAACNPGDPDVDSLAATQGLPNLLVNLSSRDWLLDASGSTVGLGDQPITLDFHSDRTATGVAPCNAYRASVALGDGTVTISDVTTTQRSCDPAVMQHETAYLAALGAVREVDLTDYDRLILTGPGGERLAFNAFDTRAALAKTWRISSVASEDRVVTPTAPSPTITFTDEGLMRVQSGEVGDPECYRLTEADWSLDDRDLILDGRGSLGPNCAVTDKVTFFNLVTNRLVGTVPILVTPTTLTLLTPSGEIALVATAQP